MALFWRWEMRLAMQGFEASLAQTMQQMRWTTFSMDRESIREQRYPYSQIQKFIFLLMQQFEISWRHFYRNSTEPSPVRFFQIPMMQYKQAWRTSRFTMKLRISIGRRIYLMLLSWIRGRSSQIQISGRETSSPKSTKLTLSSIYYTFCITFQHIQMQCCPKGSWPQLAVEYAPQGQTHNVDGVSIYHVGQGNKPLLLISDIFGSTSGRHQTVADIFASWGYNVFLPEILNPPYIGDQDLSAIIANIKGQSVEGMEATFSKVTTHLKSHGFEKFICIGFCWGVWFAFRMAAKYDCFKAIVGPHPSIGLQKMLYGSNEMELTEKVRCPAYFLPAGNDGPNVKEKGEVVELLGKRFGVQLTGTTTYPQMMHGWVVRGDLKDPKVYRDFHGAMDTIKDYLSKFQ